MTREAVARLCLIAGVLHLSGSMPEAQTAAGVPPRTASNATIRARVLGASDGRPVRGATVRLEDLGAVPDDSGIFELRRLSPGNHQASVAKSGFITRRAAMEAVRGGTSALQELRLVRGAVIGGFVYVLRRRARRVYPRRLRTRRANAFRGGISASRRWRKAAGAPRTHHVGRTVAEG